MAKLKKPRAKQGEAKGSKALNMYEEQRTITAIRWKLHTESKEFFLGPGAIKISANRELLFAKEEPPCIDGYSRKEKY